VIRLFTGTLWWYLTNLNSSLLQIWQILDAASFNFKLVIEYTVCTVCCQMELKVCGPLAFIDSSSPGIFSILMFATCVHRNCPGCRSLKWWTTEEKQTKKKKTTFGYFLVSPQEHSFSFSVFYHGLWKFITFFFFFIVCALWYNIFFFFKWYATNERPKHPWKTIETKIVAFGVSKYWSKNVH